MKTKTNVRDLTKAEIEEFLTSQKVGLLALNDGERSYAVPLAYYYDDDTIYLTMAKKGRKGRCIDTNTNVCFTVYWIPEGFGALGTMSWKSVICDGVLERITEPDDITHAVRTGEKRMGMPPGTWDRLLEMTLKNPAESSFWRIRVSDIGGKGVEDFKEEFEE